MAFIECCQSLLVDGVEISASEIVIAVIDTNEYLVNLHALFSKIGFNLFAVLGQRNISGVIGEIFSRYLSEGNDYLENNPHPDGRPDILCVPNKEVREYLQTCYDVIEGKLMPNKGKLAPFAYGGVEVKCTIGDPIPAVLRRRRGISEFEIGEPRVDSLLNLNWWAHHTKSSHLLGLYYDYSAAHRGVPQVMAGFYGALTADDWTTVSIGNAENKKTSNTSLRKTGKDIMKSQPIFVVSDRKYIAALKYIGVALQDDLPAN